MLTLDQTVRRSEQSASRIIGGEAIIMTSADSKIRTLNETGSRIWELIADSHTIATVAETIAREFDVSAEQARDDALTFLGNLLERGMITVDDTPGMDAT